MKIATAVTLGSLGVCSILCAAVVVMRGVQWWVSGAAAGLCITLLGVLLHIVFLPKASVMQRRSFVFFYIVTALLRFVTLLGTFCAAVFLFRFDPLGLFAGIGTGFILATAVAIFRLRRAGQESIQGS